MISRTDFTAPEWQELQTAVMGTIRYMTLISPNFYGDIKETLVARQTIHNYTDQIQSGFIKELVDTSDYESPIPEYASDSAGGLEPPVLRAITNSVAAIQKRDPESVPLFKNLILKLAYRTAEARKGINPDENAAFQKISLALEASPTPVTKEWDPKNPLA